MDIVQLITSVNKISLVAFLAILVFLVYELNLLRKEWYLKTKPSIPNFNPTNIKAASLQEIPEIKIENQAPVRKSNKLLLTALFLMLILFGGLTVFSAVKQKNQSSSPAEPQVVIQTVNSKGIRVFNSQWQEVTPDILSKIKPGEELIAAVETIDDADIDYARIKINEVVWKPEQITTLFNKENKVFFRRFQVPGGERKLKIDAQLHSRQNGWLGD